MPLIIDANRSGDFNRPFKHHAPEIIKRITQKRLIVVLGGKLLKELAETHIRELIVEWSRIGIIRKINDMDLSAEEDRYIKMPIKCDDPHVLALASVSKSRLLYTDDKNLILDFKNIDIMKPQGKVFTTKTKGKIVCNLLNKNS